MECVPAARLPVKEAVPEDSVPVPRVVVPSRKVTVPVGVPLPVDGATVAEKLTLWPAVGATGDRVKAVVVGARVVEAGPNWLREVTRFSFVARSRSGRPSLFRSAKPTALVEGPIGTPYFEANVP